MATSVSPQNPNIQSPQLKNAGKLIIVLAMLAAFAPLATDMYLPGFSQMAEAYQTDHSHIEGTLAAFFLGLALGQALYGPLIDRFGRRIPLMIGVSLFFIATLGCLLTRDIEVFTGFRILQAVGGCAGMIVGRALVNDLYGPTESARVLSLLMMMMTMAPIVAPMLGGWFMHVAGWQAIFLFLLAYSALCAILVWRYVPETITSAQRTPMSMRSILQSYGELMKNRNFMIPTLVGGCTLSGMFAYITGSPFVFMAHFGLDEQQYAWLFGLIAFGIAVGAMINRIGLKYRSVSTMLGAALCLNLVGALGALLMAETEQMWLMVFPLWCVVASLGLIGANAAATAMAATGTHPGSGSALIGMIQFGTAFAVSSLVALAQNGTAYPMTIAMFTVSALAVTLWFSTIKLRQTPQSG